MNSPGQFVPPAAPQKKRPSCWLIGGLGCLGLIVIGGAIIAYFIYAGMHSPFAQQVKNFMGQESQIPAAEEQLATIRTAVMEFKAETGKYPKKLTQLVPRFIPTVSGLHSSLDSSPDPTHISFLYAKPGRKPKGNAEILCLSITTQLTLGGTTVNTTQNIAESLNGQFEESTYQNGRFVSRQPLTPPAAAQ